MSQNVTISEAARILGVSRRTVQRRIAAGELPVVEAGGRRYVLLTEEQASAARPHSPAGRDVTRDKLGILRAQLEAVTSERDYLRQQLTQAVGALYALGEQKAISLRPPRSMRPLLSHYSARGGGSGCGER